MWANSTDGFSDAIGADVASTQTLSANNSVGLVDGSGSLIDAVAWGTGSDQYVEGGGFTTNPTANQLLKRRSISMDTGDNAADFELQ